MTADKLKSWIISMVQDIEFVYQGKEGSICPFGIDHISVVFGDIIKDYTDIDDVMSDRMYEGKSLTEIADQIKF